MSPSTRSDTRPQKRSSSASSEVTRSSTPSDLEALDHEIARQNKLAELEAARTRRANAEATRASAERQKKYNETRVAADTAWNYASTANANANSAYYNRQEKHHSSPITGANDRGKEVVDVLNTLNNAVYEANRLQSGIKSFRRGRK